MWDENRPTQPSARGVPDLKPAGRTELVTARPALKELNQRTKEQHRTTALGMNKQAAGQPQVPAKPGSPSRFDAVRALDEDENWRERTEVITKHDHNLNKQLAREIVEQIVDSAASTPTEETSSSVSFATVSSNPPAPLLPGTLPDVVRVTHAAGPQDTDSGDSEYESASEQEDVTATSTAVRSEASILADELLGLCLQTPLKPRGPHAAAPQLVDQPRQQTTQQQQQQEEAQQQQQQQQQQETVEQQKPVLDVSLPSCQQVEQQGEGDLLLPPPPEDLLTDTGGQQQLSAPSPPVSGETEQETAGSGESQTGGKTEVTVVADEPAPLAEGSAPIPEEPLPAKEELVQAPGGEVAAAPKEPTPVPEEPTPVPEESTPVSGEPAPAFKEPTPVFKEPTPVSEESAPVPKESSPAPEELVPVPEGTPEAGGAEPLPIESVGGSEAVTTETRPACPPVRSASPPIRGGSPPIRGACPPIGAASPPIRSASPPVRSASPPIRSASPPIRSASPPIRAASPPIRSGSPPIRPGGAMTQTGDDDEPIPPKVGYNLDFLDDPNFNPFSSGSGIKLSPPSSPKSSLPPLKAAKAKKQREAAEETKAADEPGTVEANGVNGAEESAAEPTEQPVKPPVKKVAKKPVRPVRRPLKKKPVPQPEPEPEQVAVEENGRSDSPPLAPPPSKGYNLDFLDNCDDPNFNPFATKSAVTNSPSGSPKAERKVAGSPPLPARSAAKKAAAKPTAEPAVAVKPGPEPEPELEPVVKPEPEREPEPEPEPESRLQEPMEVEEDQPDPRGGGDASTSVHPEAKPTNRTALMDTAPLDFEEVTAASAADQEMASASGDQFVEATNFFTDPSALDRLAEHGDGRLGPNLARNSLYVKFDPLLGRPSVLPELRRLNEGAEESAPAVPRQLTSVKSDLIAFSPGKEPTEPTQTPPAAAPAPATDLDTATPPAAAPAAPAPGTGDGSVSQLLKKQELYFQDQLLKKDREMTAMKNANSKLIQHASNNKTEKLLEGATTLEAMLANENGQLRRKLKTSLPRLTAERDEARQEVANAEAMFADLHRKYEKSKAVLQEHRRNAEHNDAICREAREQAARERQRYDMLQQHAEEAHTRLQTELEAAKKAHQAELLTLKAKLQLAENREAKLKRENREITTICDELIQKMGDAR